MTPNRISCPACGAGRDIHNPGVITVVCDYCGNAIYWDEDKIKDAGQQSILPEGFTRLYRGACGSLGRRRFCVMGRVRYSFGKGFWDEWFLEFEDRQIAWLTEDNHELALQTRTTMKKPPLLKSLKPGSRFTVRKIGFIVQELGMAECLGMEGDLPISVSSGETYAFADASSPDGRYILGIEFDCEPPSIFVGKWLDYRDLILDDEGIEW